MQSLDITQSALRSGLADKALKHYNRSMPWGARKRKVSNYSYKLHVNSKGRAKLWMYKSQKPSEAVMYFIFNESIGALLSTDGNTNDVSMLSESEILCIQEARLCVLEARLAKNK